MAYDKPPAPLSITAHAALIRKVVPLVWGGGRILFCTNLALNLIAGLLPLAGIWLNSSLVGLLAKLGQPGVEAGAITHPLVVLLGEIACLAAFGAILGQFNSAIQVRFQQQVSNHIQGLISQKATALDLACFENSEFHNKMQNATTESGTRPLAIVRQLMDIASTLATLVSMFVVVYLWHSWLIPLILIQPVVLLVINGSLSRKTLELRLKKTELQRRAGYLSALAMGPFAAKEIRLFGLGDFILARLRSFWKELADQQWRMTKRRLFSRGALSAVTALNQPAAVAYAVSQVLAGHINFRRFSFYTQAILTLQGRLNQLAGSIGVLYENNLFVASVFEFLAIEPKVEAVRGRRQVRVGVAPPLIEFRNVRFRYPGCQSRVLDGVSFRIEPGERLALVGQNGAGKSTIVKLLAGLYEPDEGKILLGGIDITEIDRADLRQHFGVILQDFLIYELSLHENVAIGDLRRMGEPERIKQAAMVSGLHAVAEKLPQEYATVLSRSFRGGHELSGGQRQMVALARAVLRGAPVLILDEPTSALDVANERRFLDTLLGPAAPAGRSVLLICHRLTAVRHAHRILVLEEGKIVEQGSHVDLIQRGGPYCRMYNLQSGMYQRGEVEADGSPSEQPGGRRRPVPIGLS